MAALFRPVLNVMRLQTRTYGSSVRNQIRHFGKSSRRLTEKEAESLNVTDFHTPSNLEKKILVWTKMYPNVEAVPATVSLAKIRKSRDLFRIRVNLAMIFTTVIGCAIMMYTGKKARNEGDSISKRGLAWQKEMQKKGREEREAAAAAKSNE